MTLSRDTVHVWWASLGRAPEPALGALLDGVERERLVAYRRQADRDRFLLGAAMVRLGCARYLGADPATVALERGCVDCGKPHGKVRLRDAAPLRFSVSHSGDRIGVAFATGAEVGLDVERIRDLDVTAMSERVLSRHESARSTAEFFRYWTRKEAVVKATGDGLRTPLEGLTVSGPDQPPRLLSWRERDDLLPGIQLYDLADHAGHRAALAVLGPTPYAVTEHDAGELLAAQ